MGNLRSLNLKKAASLVFYPRPPYHFDANFHKPSHFPSSDNIWEKGKYWITMLWQGKCLGLKFENQGTPWQPKIKLTLFSQQKLTPTFIDTLIPELNWRFNFDQDILQFCQNFQNHSILGPVIKKWTGMKPIAANSLYETLMIYFVLQNATVKRSVQMLENLFTAFGQRVVFDGKTLSCFWSPQKMAKVKEEKLRVLKVGYRAKFFLKVSQQFAYGKVNEFALRQVDKESLKKELLKFYGIGPASLEYLLFEDFYFLDALETTPPWEQKIMSRLIFNKELVPQNEILNFFQQFSPFQKLAFHYLWEDLFWQRKHKKIDWLEKEIRL